MPLQSKDGAAADMLEPLMQLPVIDAADAPPQAPIDPISLAKPLHE